MSDYDYTQKEELHNEAVELAEYQELIDGVKQGDPITAYLPKKNTYLPDDIAPVLKGLSHEYHLLGEYRAQLESAMRNLSEILEQAREHQNTLQKQQAEKREQARLDNTDNGYDELVN